MRALHGREVVIVDAARTPIGRGHPQKGVFRDVHPNDLLGATYRVVIERSGIDPGTIDAVVAGCVQQYGEQMLNIGRNAWLQAGLPEETAASTVDAQCGSAQQAVSIAAALVACGVHDVVIGAGVEHMGHVPLGAGWGFVENFGTPWPRELLDRYQLVPQGIAAERVAERWGISRHELDELGLRSHRLAARATDEFRFEREVVPIGRNGTPSASTRASGGTRASSSSLSSSRRSLPTAGSRRATPRRSPTAPPRCC